MIRIRWTVPAANDLEVIGQYLKENLPYLAQSTIRRIYEHVRSLKKMPLRGRRGLRTGTRELVLTPLPYIIAYKIKNETVEILNIWHDAQDRN